MTTFTTTQANTSTAERTVLSVSQLNRLAKHTLEQLPLFWIEGEISNLSKPSSGHWYFTLKDQIAQVRCAMFKNRNLAVKFRVEHGSKVVVRAKISLYEGRGDYQLIVEHIEEAGLGDLHRQFEQLKQTLNAKGLFDSSHKKPLPELPLHIGVITSPTGAAVKDVCSVLRRRFPSIPVTIIPTVVQGNGAAAEIIKALYLAQDCGLFDVLLITRGGGSLEDLWCFNDEQLAHAIYDCPIPIVSAVGHEIDFTIADFVADVRAPTPSAAAELISPNRIEYLNYFLGYQKQLSNVVLSVIKEKHTLVKQLRAQINHPGEKLQNQSQRLDHLEIRMQSALQSRIRSEKQTVAQLVKNFKRINLHSEITRKQELTAKCSKELTRNLNIKLNKLRTETINIAQRLNAVNPLAVLERGYSMTTFSSGEVITDSEQVAVGDDVSIKLAKGSIACTVKTID